MHQTVCNYGNKGLPMTYQQVDTGNGMEYNGTVDWDQVVQYVFRVNSNETVTSDYFSLNIPVALRNAILRAINEHDAVDNKISYPQF